MRYVPALLVAVVALVLVGFAVTLLQVDTMVRVVSDVRGDLQPSELKLAPSPTGPLEVTVNQAQPCVTLKKTVDGVEISMPCCKLENESFAEFAVRCRDDFDEFCAAWEGR